MARANDTGGWDFIEVGKIYQYKEDWCIAMVQILEDNSTDEEYKFKLKTVKATHKLPDTFEVYHSKTFTGAYSGMLQFYPENQEEYYVKEYKHIYE